MLRIFGPQIKKNGIDRSETNIMIEMCKNQTKLIILSKHQPSKIKQLTQMKFPIFLCSVYCSALSNRIIADIFLVIIGLDSLWIQFGVTWYFRFYLVSSTEEVFWKMMKWTLSLYFDFFFILFIPTAEMTEELVTDRRIVTGTFFI